MKEDKITDYTPLEIQKARKVLAEVYPEIDNWTLEDIATQCCYMREFEDLNKGNPIGISELTDLVCSLTSRNEELIAVLEKIVKEHRELRISARTASAWQRIPLWLRDEIETTGEKAALRALARAKGGAKGHGYLSSCN